MSGQGISSLGTPVLTYEDIKRKIEEEHSEHHGLTRTDLDETATIASSFIKYSVGDQVTRSAMIQLTNWILTSKDTSRRLF
jgi:hypothetical protein